MNTKATVREVRFVSFSDLLAEAEVDMTLVEESNLLDGVPFTTGGMFADALILQYNAVVRVMLNNGMPEDAGVRMADVMRRLGCSFVDIEG